MKCENLGDKSAKNEQNCPFLVRDNRKTDFIKKKPQAFAFFNIFT